MSRVVVLLRGVNVGRHNRISMADFRGVLAAVGGTGVQTYLQSGNAVLDWTGRSDELAAAVSAELQSALGLSVLTFVRTAAELAEVVEENPYPTAGLDPTLLHVAFLERTPDPHRVAEVDHSALLPDRMQVRDRVLYLRYETSSQQSPLAKVRLGVESTSRNWRTVTALHELCG